MTSMEHQPVLLQEVIQGLNIQPDGIYIDATFGRGGHSHAILAKLNNAGRLLVLDKDPEAYLVAAELSQQDKRVISKQASFAELLSVCEKEGLVGKVNGILMDLGVSSPQLDTAARGFSFRLDGPLDMRMDPTTGISAAEWINQAEEAEIRMVLKTFGEERFYRRIARAITNARLESPITTTARLAEIVKKANPAWEKNKHPATRCFQAIRIYLNRELEELNLGLEQALEVLANAGRLAVISFHSLEDRIVKRFIQKQERGDEYPIDLPILAKDLKQTLKRVSRKIKPSLKETNLNARSRSAVLRLAEKIGSFK